MSLKKHHIVFVECDSMDGRAFGAMGLPPVKRASPALDTMAQNGVLSLGI
jgi:hypothetical protein